MPRMNKLNKHEPDFRIRIWQRAVAKGMAGIPKPPDIESVPPSPVDTSNGHHELRAVMQSRPPITEYLGSGVFSDVGRSTAFYKGTPVVIKENKPDFFDDSRFEGGIVWALYAACNRGKELPEIYGIDLRGRPRVYMEELSDAHLYNEENKSQFMDMHRSFRAGFMDNVAEVTDIHMFKHGTALKNMFLGNLHPDLHEGNVMRRGNDLVVTDPVSRHVPKNHPNVQALIERASHYCTVLQ